MRTDTGLTWPPPDPHRVARQSIQPRHMETIEMESKTAQRLRRRGVASSSTEQTSFAMATSDADGSSDSGDNTDERHEWRNAEGETLKDFGVDPEDDHDIQSLHEPSTTEFREDNGLSIPRL